MEKVRAARKIIIMIMEYGIRLFHLKGVRWDICLALKISRLNFHPLQVELGVKCYLIFIEAQTPLLV